MPKYYIELNKHYFNSFICKGKAFHSKKPTNMDFFESFFTPDPSQMKVFHSKGKAISEAKNFKGSKVFKIADRKHCENHSEHFEVAI